MHSQKFIIILLSFLSFIIISTEAQRQTYRYHFCPNTTTFTANSTYQANLNFLLSSISSNASDNTNGFYNSSAGQDPNDVYGLFLCRGDVATEVCQNCVTFATQDVVQLCPIEVEAILWYDECLLRYSDRSFFSTMDEGPAVSMFNIQDIITNDPARFNRLLVDTMNDAATQAASAPLGAKKFAVKEVNFTSSQDLYCLVQCTPDLSSFDCNRCFHDAISRLPSCCSGKQGGRVLLPSCNVRYEVYQFYNATAVWEPPPPPLLLPSPPTSEKSGISTVTIVAIVIPIAVSILLCCMGLCFLRRRARQKKTSIQEDNVGNETTTVESSIVRAKVFSSK